jgi:hypothetical protein
VGEREREEEKVRVRAGARNRKGVSESESERECVREEKKTEPLDMGQWGPKQSLPNLPPSPTLQHFVLSCACAEGSSE